MKHSNVYNVSKFQFANGGIMRVRLNATLGAAIFSFEISMVSD
jgi:hypothetical protein